MSQTVRLDAWLNFACLFKTRSQASKAISLGRVRVNGKRVKSHHTAAIGEELTLERGEQVQIVVIEKIAEHNVSKKEAKSLYSDRTPAPTEQEIQIRTLDRMMKLKFDGKGKPSRRERKDLYKVKGKG